MRLMAWTAAAALLVAIPAHADDWDFVLINDSGKEIKTIEISPSGAQAWVANRIDEGVKSGPVKTGGRTTVHFDKNDQCRYDVKATFADDSSEIWTNINVCDNAYVTVRYRNGAPVVTAN